MLETSKIYLREILKEHSFSPLELSQMAYKYRMKKQREMALWLGELNRLRAPDHQEAAKELARAYLEGENILAAAFVFDGLSSANERFLPEASELWRKAGYLKRAESLAIKIKNPKKSLQERIAIALTSKNYQYIAELSPVVQRGPLKSNQIVQYSLAYAYFMLGKFDQVDRYLKNITDGKLADKALRLREAVFKCREKSWACL